MSNKEQGKTYRMDIMEKLKKVEQLVIVWQNSSRSWSHSAGMSSMQWQCQQLQSLKANLPKGWVLVTCDFADNFLCRYQDKPKSAHWAYRQVTIFPVVSFYRCPSGSGELKWESLVFIYR